VTFTNRENKTRITESAINPKTNNEKREHIFHRIPYSVRKLTRSASGVRPSKLSMKTHDCLQ
jgi:hypothetical protein